MNIVYIDSRFIYITIICTTIIVALQGCGQSVKPGSDLSGHDFSGKDLRDEDFTDVDLSLANLSNTNLAGADLRTVNLSGANLSGANLSGANLSGANLSGADLTRANLDDSDLSNSILIGARLDSLDLSSTKGTDTLILDSLMSWNETRIDSLTSIQSAMTFVCENGSPAPEAAAYTPGPEPHPTVILSYNEEYDIYDSLESTIELKPLSTRSVELVLCVGEKSSVVIETCTYTPPPDIIRYRYQTEVTLRQARTGSIIRQEVLKGSTPRRCNQSEPIQLSRLNGSHVTLNDITEWYESMK